MSVQGLERRHAGPERVVGLVIVIALHAAVLWLLLQHRLIPAPAEAMTLFVNFIAPPAPEPPVPPVAPKPPPPKREPRPIEKPQPRQIVAETPVVAPDERVVPAPPPEPPPPPAPVMPPPAKSPPPSLSLPQGPIALATELSVVCPERTAPDYPSRSRRNGEEGTVLLRVELTEAGDIGAARIQTSSGFSRLDEAALAAVRTWRCQPPHRNGQPAQATALQPFKFVLQGN
jgi:protein TonB